MLSLSFENYSQTIIVSTEDCLPTIKVRNFFTEVSDYDTFLIPDNIDSYTIVKYIFDTKQELYEQYLKSDKTVSKDSVTRYLKSKDVTLANQINQKTRNSLCVLLHADTDSFIYIIPDLNFNDNFKDDKMHLFKKNGRDTISVSLEYVENAVVYSSLFNLELSTSFYNDEWKLLIASAYSKKGIFFIGNKKYHVEVSPSGLSDFYSMKNVGVNFSQPDSPLKKIDFVNTLILKPKTDTIIAGEFQFVIDSIGLFGQNIRIKYQHRINNIGYREGDFLPNFSFIPLGNNNLTDFKTFIGSSKYVLLDFWGTWCGPCIENFPLLKKMEKVYSKNKLLALGIACEYKIDEAKVKSVLKREGVTWINTMLNKFDEDFWDIRKFLKIDTFPTYLLVSNDLKIIIRSAGVEGLSRISKYLESNP